MTSFTLYPDSNWNIAIAEQAKGEIVVLDASAEEWDDDRSILWTWRPPHAVGASDPVSGWGNPTDIRLRKSSVYGGYCFVTCASLGYAGLIRYPETNEVIWSSNVSGNLHAIDLLPDGNVAIAASTEGWIRVYAVGHGAQSNVYAEYSLPGAHGVHWDTEYNWLWVMGDHYLTALEIKGTPMQPVLEEVMERRCMLPSFGGHDLYPVFGDSNRLWVTTNEDSYMFVKSTKHFISLSAEREKESLPHRKSISSYPSNMSLEIVPDYYKDPPGPCSSRNNWTTDTIDFNPSGPSRSRKGTAIYKARVWHCDDQGIR